MYTANTVCVLLISYTILPNAKFQSNATFFRLEIPTHILDPEVERYFSMARNLSFDDGGDFPVKSVYSLP